MESTATSSGARSRARPQPLAGLRVLECGDTLAIAYAGRLLSDLGADVVKIEPPEGDPLRALGPFADGIPNQDLSASFAYFHAGKRSVLATRPVADDEQVHRLLARADVVLRSTRRGEDWVSDRLLDRRMAEDPSLIAVDLSTLGRVGRPGPHPMNDLLALAACGLLSVNTWSLADPEAGPLRYRGELASIHAACAGVLALLGALAARRTSGLGQRVDVSAQAAVASVLATAMARYGYAGSLPARHGSRSVAPWGFYRCSDGMVLIQCTKDDEFRRLVELLGSPEWGSMEIFETTAQRDATADVLDMFLAEALAGWPLADFLAAAFEHRVAAAPIHSAADILGWDHLASRGFLQPVPVSDGRRSALLPMPGRAWRYDGVALEPRPAPPRLGEADPGSLWPDPAARGPAVGDAAAGDAAAGDAAAGDPAAGDAAAPASERPLAGVRVIDLTWVWAGPFAAMQLAHLGAEVIRVETSTRVDVTRALPPYADDIPGVNRSGYFNQYNQGKKSVALNLRTARGMDILRQLIATADVVIDNMSAGALARMGLPYETLCEINPRIVAVSMTGFGESGPYRDHPAYGSLIDALSGTAIANGTVGGGPTDLVMSLPDPMAGIHTAIATVAAVYRAQATGVGTRVECAMLEACLAAFPWPVLHRATVGAEVPVIGNRDEERSPHGVFRCRGEDEWLAVAVEDDAQFAALAAVMGKPGLATDERFADLRSRRVHEDALEDCIACWAAGQDAAKAADTLRLAGVPAEMVARIDEVYRSQPLLARGFFTEFEHDEVGRRRMAGVGWVASRSDMTPVAAAPVLGRHTRQVLTDVLRLRPEEIDDLVASGVAV